MGDELQVSTTAERLQLTGVDSQYGVGIDFVGQDWVVKTYQCGEHILESLAPWTM
jgi:hypothetical protein